MGLAYLLYIPLDTFGECLLGVNVTVYSVDVSRYARLPVSLVVSDEVDGSSFWSLISGVRRLIS